MIISYKIIQYRYATILAKSIAAWSKSLRADHQRVSLTMPAREIIL